MFSGVILTLVEQNTMNTSQRSIPADALVALNYYYDNADMVESYGMRHIEEREDRNLFRRGKKIAAAMGG